jgi:hypothetical protein
MIGFQTDHQKRLFYSFDLEGHVPQHHLLCGINTPIPVRRGSAGQMKTRTGCYEDISRRGRTLEP